MASFSFSHFLVLFIVIVVLFWPLILHFRQEKILLQHSLLGNDIQVPFLYAWTSLVFGCFVPLLRKDFKWFFIYLVGSIVTCGLSNIVLAFFYNKSYIESLIKEGYLPANERSKQLLISKNIIKDFS